MVFRDFQDNPVALALLGAIGVFLCGAPFEGTPFYARRIHLSCKSKSFCNLGAHLIII